MRARTHKCAVYARISLDGSGAEAGVTRQKKDCLRHCTNRKLDVAEVIIDNDISASKYSRKQRPGYARLLELIDAGEVNTIVTWHLDRLYRQPIELEGLIRRIDNGVGLTVVTLNGDIDLTNDDGQAMARMMVTMAAKASADTSRRLKAKRQDSREKGEPPLSNAFGWRDRWTHDPTEAGIVAELADRMLAGESLASLACDLTERGVPMKRGGATWQPGSVRQVLKAPRHAGLLVHDGELIRGKWDPIIEPAKWHRVQAALALRGDRYRFPRAHTLLTGLVHCGECGGILTRTGKSDHAFLRCGTRIGQQGCGVQIISDVVETYIVNYVLKLTDRENLSAELAKLNGKDDVSKMTQELAEIERSLKELQRLVALHARTGGREGISPSFAAPTSRELETDAERLRAQLAAASTGHGALGRYVKGRGILRRAWESGELSLDQRRTLIRELLTLRKEQVVVMPRHKGQAVADRVEVHQARQAYTQR